MKIKNLIRKFLGYDKVSKKFFLIQNRLNDLNDSLVRSQRLQQELLYANKYHDTIIGYDWLQYKDLSLGGATVDYAFCYTLVRALNTMKPSSIIECGLGQSSKIIHQYADFYKKKAITCEHDFGWSKFFLDEIQNKYPINIEYFELENTIINGCSTLTYKDFPERINPLKFDFIIIDGPYGSPNYSRSQVIDIVKNNLAGQFCIIIDDFERSGEQETWDIVKKTLQERGIEFLDITYSARQDHALICSKDLRFLTWL